MSWEIVWRRLFAALGGVVAAIEPTAPYVLIFTLAVLYDMYSAWSLARRVHKEFPERAHEWKFTSVKMSRVFVTLLKGYAMIVLAHFVHLHITGGLGFDVTKVVSGALVFWQVWSILENESSCNGAAWARVAQRVLVDKTSRHFDVDLSELLPSDKETRNDEVV